MFVKKELSFTPQRTFSYIYIYVEQVKKNKFQLKQLFPYMLSQKNYEDFSSLNCFFCLQTRIFPCVSRFPFFKIDQQKHLLEPKTRSQKRS